MARRRPLAEQGERVTARGAAVRRRLAATLRGATGPVDSGRTRTTRGTSACSRSSRRSPRRLPARPKNVRIKLRGRYYKSRSRRSTWRSMSPVMRCARSSTTSASRAQDALPAALVSAEDGSSARWAARSTACSLARTPRRSGECTEVAASFARHRIPHISLMKVVVRRLKGLRSGPAPSTGTRRSSSVLTRRRALGRFGSACDRIRAGGTAQTGALVTGIDVEAEGHRSGSGVSAPPGSRRPVVGAPRERSRGRDCDGLGWSLRPGGQEERIACDRS